jgi:5-methylthioadenosine/S-adenosylhomocysteine deaminase
MSLMVKGARLDGAVIGLRAEDGRIAELGADVKAQPGDDVIDADGMALSPGLINGHTHAAMTLFRGHGDELPLRKWLEEVIWPVEERLHAEDVYWGTRLACVEMIRSGTVRFWDMYWHPGATARAVEDAGLRATIGAPLIDVGAASRELPVHIHLAETEDEVSRCIEEHGARPAAYLDRLGLLGPRTLLAHGVWLDDAELELIAERGATVVSNPVANLKLAVGRAFPYRAARDAGVRLGLGTDGPGSNNSLDLFSDMKTFALIQKHEAHDPAAISAAEAWELAIGRRSPLLGAERRLARGEPADFLLLADAPELGLGDFTSALVYTASGGVVDTTVVHGRVLMRRGRAEGSDEILARGRERARRLGLA